MAKALAEVGPLTGQCGELVFNAPEDFELMEGALPEKLPELIMVAEAQVKGGQPTASKVEVKLSRDVARVRLTEPVTLTLGVRARIWQIAARGRRPIVSRLAQSETGRAARNLRYVAIAFVLFYLITQPARAALAVSNALSVFSAGITAAIVGIAGVVGVVLIALLMARAVSYLPMTHSGAVVINTPRSAARQSFWVRNVTASGSLPAV